MCINTICESFMKKNLSNTNGVPFKHTFSQASTKARQYESLTIDQGMVKSDARTVAFLWRLWGNFEASCGVFVRL